MERKDLLAAHLQETTIETGIRKKTARIRRAILWLLGAFSVGLIISLAQMRQRDKVDAIAVKEGKIPAITINIPTITMSTR